MSILPSVKLYEIPEPLRKYIQDKAASGIQSLGIVPFIFPVFVTNPSGYTVISEWHDRNPIDKLQVFAANDVPPHGATTRWSYTVPTNKKAWVEIVNCFVLRITAATIIGRVYSQIMITTPRATLTKMFVAKIMNNNVGASAQVQMNAGMVLKAGNVIEAQTGDFNTGGTTDLIASAKITEFDA